MTKVNSNNGNETKSDIFPWVIFKSDIIFHWLQNTKMTFIIGAFQFNCKSMHKHVKRNKVTQYMSKSDSSFPYLQSSTLFK